MKQLSLVINIVLLIAVGTLYYLHFSSGKKTAQDQPIKKAVPKTSLVELDKAPIAYVDLDSLNEKITYIKERRQELEAEQKAIENEWMNASRALQKKRDDFIRQHDGGKTLTEEMALAFQEELMQQQQNIEDKRQNASQKLSEKSYKFMSDIQKKLKDFLLDYNSNGTYKYIFTTGTGLDYIVFKDSTLNITDDVISGMNEKIGKETKK